MAKRHYLKGKLALAFVAILLAAAFILIRAYSERASVARVEAAMNSDDGIIPVGTLLRSTKVEERRTAEMLRKDYDARFSRFLERNPALVPAWKTVPDELNGFLQWLEFEESHWIDGVGSLDLPPRLQFIISGAEPWDHDYVAAELVGRRELLGEVARIGLLPDQSAANIAIDRYSFMSARLTKQCTDLLLAEARIAAEEGDAGLARERVQAVIGIAAHYSGIEMPSLLMETVSILLRMSAERQMLEHVLPALDLDQASLAEWLAPLSIGDYDTADFANVIRGETSILMRGYVIPMLEGKYAKIYARDVPDPELLMDSIAGRLVSLADEIERSSIQELSRRAPQEAVVLPSGLSPGAEKVYDMMFVGVSAWARGWVRAASMHSRTEAALAILTGTEVAREVITGLPFAFDPVNRVLSHPDDDRLKNISADPIVLP